MKWGTAHKGDRLPRGLQSIPRFGDRVTRKGQFAAEDPSIGSPVRATTSPAEDLEVEYEAVVGELDAVRARELGRAMRE
jgi:hypothetical protein